MITKASEKGQALVLITLAAIGLFAFAALAIDGSAVFSDRRHAQNAADTASLEAALTKVRGGNWATEGLDRSCAGVRTRHVLARRAARQPRRQVTCADA